MNKFQIINSKLASFLYDLMRDHLPVGDVQKLVNDASTNTVFTNGYLAQIAEDFAERLLNGTDSSTR